MNIEQIGQIVDKTRLANPLVHHITNYVTVNDCANITLAIGASPVMSDEIDEIEEIVSISSSLVINIGTLNKRTIESMFMAAKTANRKQIPVILDPVGAGATKLRTDTALRLINECKISVIRGNASEIKVISQGDGFTRGVDANVDDGNDSQVLKMIAANLSRDTGAIVAITGVVDVITNGTDTALIENGHPLMSKVTGTGCMCTSLIGSMCGTSNDYFGATITAIASMGIAGQLAYENLPEPKQGNSTYRNHIIDEIANMDSSKLCRFVKVTFEKTI